MLAHKLYADREKTGDIIFIVGSERIAAHKSVLAAISPKYKAQFFGSQPDDGEIVVADISADAFEEFIKFCYIEDVNLTLKNIEDILNLAKQCLINHFVTKCHSFLIRMAENQNPLRVYRLSILYEFKTLQDICEFQIATELSQLFDSDDFLESDREVLIHILDIESINFTEVVIFENCIAWARAECQRSNIDGNKAENLRAALGSAIDHIRFRSMSINQFVRFDKLHEGFFSAEEFREITNIIVNVDDFGPRKFNQTQRVQQCSNFT